MGILSIYIEAGILDEIFRPLPDGGKMNLISKDLIVEDEENDDYAPTTNGYKSGRVAPTRKSPEPSTKMNQNNMCVPGMMSTCGCYKEKSFDNMKKLCNHAVKSTVADRCMHLVFGEYCDSLKAQTSPCSKTTVKSLGI